MPRAGAPHRTHARRRSTDPSCHRASWRVPSLAADARGRRGCEGHAGTRWGPPSRPPSRRPAAAPPNMRACGPFPASLMPSRANFSLIRVPPPSPGPGASARLRNLTSQKFILIVTTATLSFWAAQSSGTHAPRAAAEPPTLPSGLPGTGPSHGSASAVENRRRPAPCQILAENRRFRAKKVSGSNFEFSGLFFLFLRRKSSLETWSGN